MDWTGLSPLDFARALIVLLVGLLFFKENILALLNKKFGLGEKEEEEQEEKVPKWAAKLQQHYNDETTELLKDILQVTRAHNDLETSVREEIREGFRVMSAKFAEYDRYGIKSHCAEKK